MASLRKVTKRSKVGLTGRTLEHAIARIAMDDDSLVATEIDGVVMRGVLPPGMWRGLVPAAPLKSGRKPAISQAVLEGEWPRARATLIRDRRRVTMTAMAEQLSAQVGYYVSPETVKRYRKRDGLSL